MFDWISVASINSFRIHYFRFLGWFIILISFSCLKLKGESTRAHISKQIFIVLMNKMKTEFRLLNNANMSRGKCVLTGKLLRSFQFWIQHSFLIPHVFKYSFRNDYTNVVGSFIPSHSCMVFDRRTSTPLGNCNLAEKSFYGHSIFRFNRRVATITTSMVSIVATMVTMDRFVYVEKPQRCRTRFSVFHLSADKMACGKSTLFC